MSIYLFSSSEPKSPKSPIAGLKGPLSASIHPDNSPIAKAGVSSALAVLKQKQQNDVGENEKGKESKSPLSPTAASSRSPSHQKNPSNKFSFLDVSKKVVGNLKANLYYNKRVYSIFGFLYDGYEVRCWWWELVVLIRKGLLIVISIKLGPGSVSGFSEQSALYNQGLASLGVLFMACVMHAYFKPYINEDFDKLETCGLLVSCLSLYFAIVGLTFSAETTRYFLTLIITILNCWWAIWAIKIYIKQQFDDFNAWVNSLRESVFTNWIVVIVEFILGLLYKMGRFLYNTVPPIRWIVNGALQFAHFMKTMKEIPINAIKSQFSHANTSVVIAAGDTTNDFYHAEDASRLHLDTLNNGTAEITSVEPFSPETPTAHDIVMSPKGKIFPLEMTLEEQKAQG